MLVSPLSLRMKPQTHPHLLPHDLVQWLAHNDGTGHRKSCQNWSSPIRQMAVLEVEKREMYLKEIITAPKCTYKDVHCCAVYNSETLKIAYMPKVGDGAH